MTDREKEAFDSFLTSVERAMVDPLLMPLVELDDFRGREQWLASMHELLGLAKRLLPCTDDDSRIQLRSVLVQIAARDWYAARMLGVENEIPF